MSSNLMQAFQGILLIFMLIGLLMGIWRGFNKSIIRFFVVIAMSLLCFFITPPIAKSVVNADISSLGINIAGVEIDSLQEGIITLLEKIGFIQELITASPTFKAFVEQIPTLILNLLIFVIGFLILTLISLLFSWLLSKLILRKVPPEKRNRFRILGGLLGVVQGIFVFAVIAVPVFGIISTTEKALNEINSNETTTQVSTSSIHNTTSDYIIVSENENDGVLSNVNLNQYNQYIKDFNNLAFVKVFKALGIKTLEEKVYSNLTTVTVNKEDVNFENEIIIAAKISSNLDSITKISSNYTEQDYNNMRNVVNDLFDSKLFSRISEEVIRYISKEWKDSSNPIAFGIRKPDLGTVGNPLLDKSLTELQNATRLTLKTDLLQTISVLECANKYGIYKLLENKTDGEELMRTLANNNGAAIEELIGSMLPSNTLTSVLPTLIQTSLNTVYNTLEIPADTQDKENKILIDILNIINEAKSLDSEELLLQQTIKENLTDYINRYGFYTNNAPTEIFNEYLIDVSNELSLCTDINQVKTVLSKSFEFDNSTISFIDMNRWEIKTQSDLNITTQITNEEWKTEKSIISSIFSNLILAYDSVIDVELGQEFANMDFASLGKALDSLRHSRLLDDERSDPIEVNKRISFNITKSLLQSTLMSNINVTTSFINTIENNWDDENFKFEDALRTLGSTISILDQFNNNKPIDANIVKDLMNGLTGSSSEMIKDLLKDEILKNNSSSSVTNAIADIVDSLASQDISNMNDESWEKEAEALSSSLELLKQTNENENFNLTTEKSAEVVDNLFESTILFEALKESAGNNDALKLQTAAANSDTLKQALENKKTQIESSGADNKTEQLAKINEIYDLFGLK